MNKFNRVAIAEDTVKCIEQGCYTNTKGQNIDLSAAIRNAVTNTKTYSSGDLDTIVENLSLQELSNNCMIEVKRLSSFEAGKQLVEQHGKVLCLNFASAKNPGGGFLSGAQAQEEALTRSSALYLCLKDQDAYYLTNRKCGTTLYTDTMILSPDVPFFKDDNGTPLDNWFPLSILTAPAVNEGAIRQNEPEKIPEIASVMLRRTEKLLALAHRNGYTHLLLGAWGCGVFRNNPEAVASYFYQFLGPNGKYARCFETVTFAILATDENSSNLKAFSERFG